MEDIRRLQKDKYRIHRLQTEVLPRLGNLITLDPVLRACSRIQNFLKRRWFTEQSTLEGIMTFRLNGKIHDLNDIAPHIMDETVFEVPGLLESPFEVDRARRNVKRVQNIHFTQQMEYDSSLCNDRRSIEPIYTNYLYKLTKINFANITRESLATTISFVISVLEVEMEKFKEINNDIYLSINGILVFLRDIQYDQYINANLVDYHLEENITGYQQHLKEKFFFLSFLHEYECPSWFPIDLTQFKDTLCSKIREDLGIIILKIQSQVTSRENSNASGSDNENETHDCPACGNMFSRVDLWPVMGSDDDDLCVCQTCYQQMCENVVES